MVRWVDYGGHFATNNRKGTEFMNRNRLIVYQYAKCSTCRDALKWLRARGYEIETIEVFDHPPTVEQLRELVGQSGLPIRRFFNTSGEVYKEMNLKDKLPGMSEEEMLKLLSSNGRLIKRPVITDGKRTTTGFKKPELEPIWHAVKG
jgi:arsenate reductase